MADSFDVHESKLIDSELKTEMLPVLSFRKGKNDVKVLSGNIIPITHEGFDPGDNGTFQYAHMFVAIPAVRPLVQGNVSNKYMMIWNPFTLEEIFYFAILQWLNTEKLGLDWIEHDLPSYPLYMGKFDVPTISLQNAFVDRIRAGTKSIVHVFCELTQTYFYAGNSKQRPEVNDEMVITRLSNPLKNKDEGITFLNTLIKTCEEAAFRVRVHARELLGYTEEESEHLFCRLVIQAWVNLLCSGASWGNWPASTFNAHYFPVREGATLESVGEYDATLMTAKSCLGISPKVFELNIRTVTRKVMMGHEPAAFSPGRLCSKKQFVLDLDPFLNILASGLFSDYDSTTFQPFEIAGRMAKTTFNIKYVQFLMKFVKTNSTRNVIVHKYLLGCCMHCDRISTDIAYEDDDFQVVRVDRGSTHFQRTPEKFGIRFIVFGESHDEVVTPMIARMRWKKIISRIRRKTVSKRTLSENEMLKLNDVFHPQFILHGSMNWEHAHFQVARSNEYVSIVTMTNGTSRGTETPWSTNAGMSEMLLEYINLLRNVARSSKGVTRSNAAMYRYTWFSMNLQPGYIMRVLMAGYLCLVYNPRLPKVIVDIYSPSLHTLSDDQIWNHIWETSLAIIAWMPISYSIMKSITSGYDFDLYIDEGSMGMRPRGFYTHVKPKQVNKVDRISLPDLFGVVRRVFLRERSNNRRPTHARMIRQALQRVMNNHSDRIYSVVAGMFCG